MISVGVLGIGMLIVAAAFPVALDQTRQAVEMSTSQLVFNEAVTKLKTQVSWLELETYFAYTMRVGNSNIYLLRDFDQKKTGPGNPRVFDNFHQDADPSATPAVSSDLVYSADSSYGWMATVQKIGDQCYKFWIFVLREPSGMCDSTGTYKFAWQRIAGTPNPVQNNTPATETKKLTIAITAALMREMSVLPDNRPWYRGVDVGQAAGGNQTIICYKRVSGGYQLGNSDDQMTDVRFMVYPVPTIGARVTRKNPVVAVYQAVITY